MLESRWHRAAVTDAGTSVCKALGVRIGAFFGSKLLAKSTVGKPTKADRSVATAGKIKCQLRLEKSLKRPVLKNVRGD